MSYMMDVYQTAHPFTPSPTSPRHLFCDHHRHCGHHRHRHLCHRWPRRCYSHPLIATPPPYGPSSPCLHQRCLANTQLDAGVCGGHPVDAQIHGWQQVGGVGVQNSPESRHEVSHDLQTLCRLGNGLKDTKDDVQLCKGINAQYYVSPVRVVWFIISTHTATLTHTHLEGICQ